MNQLYQRSFLRLMDFNLDEINRVLCVSSNLKCQKFNQSEVQWLKDKNILLLFESNSTRTRCAFEVAAFDQGARVTCLTPGISQIGYKESIKDSARVLSGMYHGILYRGYNHDIVEEFKQYSNVPVWNGLTEQFHPTQVLADLMTMQEQVPFKSLQQMKLAYVGDARNNISNSLLEAAIIIGFDFRIVSPKELWPNSGLLQSYQQIDHINKKNIFITENILEGIKDVDFLYTDVWVSMGENEKIWEYRIKLLSPYQVNKDMIIRTGNTNVKFLHCLPALHNNKTVIGKNITNKYHLFDGLEVTDEIFESKYSVVFNQAENRLHTIKALMILTLLRYYQ